ncbi:hypothetical protein [Prosthecobacter sp.]|uniref:hypothetical protein n=1 Tax=Prosthecobacter sp. TaxID=1965333 RepID=UPI003784D398
MSPRRLATAAALGVFLVLAGAQAAEERPAIDAGCTEMRQQMEAAAGRLSHFATQDIIHNRHDERRWPEKMLEEQVQLMKELHQWAQRPECLRVLIKHDDAKVRTLALGALFVREEAHDLPLIAASADDTAATFPEIHASLNSALGPLPMAEFEGPQTVGDVARAMLDFYFKASTKKKLSFDEYWKQRANRKHCAGWFLVKLNRADRLSSPIQPSYQADVQRVLDEIHALPMPERAWTLLYVRSMSPVKLVPLSPDAACVSALREAGPAQIVRFLKQRRITDDPDLWLDALDPSSSRSFEWMAIFLLRHARELLRAEDAPVLLDCESEQRSTTRKTLTGASPYWAAAAAELTGERDLPSAIHLIDEALERFPMKVFGRFPIKVVSGGGQQAVLMGALWRAAGAREKQRFVEWFYLAQARLKESRNDASNHGPMDFLYLVRGSNRPDIPEFLGALVNDGRFDETDWYTLKALLETANDGLTTPLVSEKDLNDAWPARRRPDQAEVLAQWRKILRQHFDRGK